MVTSSSSSVTINAQPIARTVRATAAHYGWTRTYIFNRLAAGDLVAVKAGRRTLVTTESADRVFASLPRASYRGPVNTGKSRKPISIVA